MSERDAEEAQPWDDELRLNFLPGTFPATELGNAERMVAQFRGDIRYCAERCMWLLWNGRHWQWDAQGLVRRKAKATVRALCREAFDTPDPDKRKDLLAWAMKSEKSSVINAMLKLAETEDGIPVLMSELDADPMLLCCENGTLELSSGELREHRRDDLMTRSTGVRYDAAATHELWDRALATACDGDAEFAGYLQRVAGYAATGLATEKKFFFLCGARDAGKSTLINALHAALGGYSKSVDFETWLERPQVGGTRGDLVGLQGARFVSSVEVKKKARWDTALLKRVTGGDIVTAAAKYENEVSYLPSYTIMLAANDAPKARDDDDGLWSRMQRIPFTRSIPPEEQISGMREKLSEPTCAAAILAWVVEGCLAWQRQGVGSCPRVEQSTADYRKENDWLGAFLELYELDPESIIPAPAFRAQYEAYCAQEGQYKESTKELAAQLSARMPGVRYVMVRGARIWRGLRLRPTEGQGGWSEQQVSAPSPAPSPPDPEPEQHSFSYEDPNPYEEEENAEW